MWRQNMKEIHLNISIKETKFRSLLNRMTNIPANYSSNKETIKCVCGHTEQMAHIYKFRHLNKEKITTQYENIFKENVENMKIVLERFKHNMEKREKIQNQKQELYETFTGILFPVECSIVNGIG